MDDAVQVDNSHVGIPVWILILLDNPHACIVIRSVSNARIPANESTWIEYATENKREKQPNTSDIQTSHPGGGRISLNKDTIIAAWTSFPGRESTNTFTVHSPSAA